MIASTRNILGLLIALGASYSKTEAIPTVEPRHVERRDLSGTSNGFLADRQGAPKNMASGIFLGLPLNGSQIPDHFLPDIGFNNMRSGGSQLGGPRRGWSRGYEDFVVRCRLPVVQ